MENHSNTSSKLRITHSMESPGSTYLHPRQHLAAPDQPHFDYQSYTPPMAHAGPPIQTKIVRIQDE